MYSSLEERLRNVCILIQLGFSSSLVFHFLERPRGMGINKTEKAGFEVTDLRSRLTRRAMFSKQATVLVLPGLWLEICMLRIYAKPAGSEISTADDSQAGECLRTMYVTVCVRVCVFV